MVLQDALQSVGYKAVLQGVVYKIVLEGVKVVLQGVRYKGCYKVWDTRMC